MAHAGNSVAASHSGPAMAAIYQQDQLDGHHDPLRPQARHRQFCQLRRDVAALDGQLAAARLPLGVDSLDSALTGGLALGRVHMLCGRPGHDGALTGFAVALLRRILARVDAAAPIVWGPAAAGGGAGMLHAAGLAVLGLDPGRLLIVDSPSPGARLAALELVPLAWILTTGALGLTCLKGGLTLLCCSSLCSSGLLALLATCIQAFRLGLSGSALVVA